MKSETKLFLGIILGTVAIVIAGVLLLSRSGAPAAKADSKILVRADSNKIASGSGTVTLVEFSDFQCPACAAYYGPVKQLVSEFKNDLTFVYRNFPLTTIHKNAQMAAQAAEAAGLQDKYWEMHDKLFETQSEWSTSDKPKEIFVAYAEVLKLDKEQFAKDIDSDTVKKKIAEDVSDANTLGVDSTPTFFLDGVKLDNPANFADFQALVKAAIKNAPVPTSASTDDYHAHANLNVYINGKPIDFSQDKYQSPEGKELNQYIHFHDGKGDLFHIHKQGMTLGDLFTSLQMTLTKDSLTDDANIIYPNNETHKLQVFVNGKQNLQFEAYVPQDLDKILITYGNDADAVRTQLESLPDDACIYSLKCPERGEPPTENCVGGLGTDCKE